MRIEVRRSVWAKLAASGFIYLIVVANIWVAEALVNAAIPLWIRVAFFVGIVWVSIGAVGVTGLTLWLRYHEPKETAGVHDDDPHH